jgi:hypothetical protein
MPVNTSSSSTPGAVSNAPAAPSKSRKSKTPRKSAPAPRTAGASAEILFQEPPNPNITPQPPYIWIDHPQERERLLGPVYVMRFGVGGAQTVELSIDGGLWQPCRLTSGYWWYDWSGIQPGKHTLVARMRTDDGRWYRTPPRTCEYRP